jgi:hypothetical protein
VIPRSVAISIGRAGWPRPRVSSMMTGPLVDSTPSGLRAESRRSGRIKGSSNGDGSILQDARTVNPNFERGNFLGWSARLLHSGNPSRSADRSTGLHRESISRPSERVTRTNRTDLSRPDPSVNPRSGSGRRVGRPRNRLRGRSNRQPFPLQDGVGVSPHPDPLWVLTFSPCLGAPTTREKTRPGHLETWPLKRVLTGEPSGFRSTRSEARWIGES